MSNKQQACFDFIKLLVEFGGVYQVNEEGYIFDNEDEPVLINVSNKGMPLRIYQSNMKAGEYAILNPLVEPLGVFNERVWFFKSRCAIIGGLVKSMMKKLAEAAINNEGEIDYDKLDMVQPHLKSFDRKFLTEIDKIKPVRLIRMHYNKKTRTATMQTDIYDEEFRNKFKGFRKRSWTAIEGLLEMFFGTDKIEETFTYKATNIGFPEADACIHLMAMVAEAIYQYVETILGDRKMRVADFMQHLPHIKEYHDVSAWFSSGNTQKSDDKEETINTRAPWQTKEISGIVPTNRYSNTSYSTHTYNPKGLVPSIMQPGADSAPMNIRPGGGIIMPNIKSGGSSGIRLRETIGNPNGASIQMPRLKS